MNPALSPLSLLKRIVPPLSSTLHKGQLGKIGVIGGCLEYTGAPFYAGIAAQRCGADLVTIICSKEAGIPIKCYSPELIVYPVIELPEEEMSTKSIDELCEMNERRITPLLSRIDSLVIGPGAGRNPVMLSTLRRIIRYAIDKKIPLVIDGDGLWAVTQEPSLIEQAKNIILTPNQMEFTRLWNEVMKEQKSPAELTPTSESSMLGVTILQKGAVDEMSDGVAFFRNSSASSMRRCGGQGDVVSGVMGVMHLWATKAHDLGVNPLLAACACTSHVVREAGRRAFEEERRAMTAMSLISRLPSIIDDSE
ncbi:hypothetical protein WA577_004654 [Blastocystis sp. JDR]